MMHCMSVIIGHRSVSASRNLTGVRCFIILHLFISGILVTSNKYLTFSLLKYFSRVLVHNIWIVQSYA